MLKFVGEDGKLKFVLLDSESEPCELDSLPAEIRRELGLAVHDDNEKTKKKPSGISQNDMQYLRGE